MPQGPLHREHVDPGFEQAGGKRPPEVVRAQLTDASGMCPLSDYASDRLGREPSGEKSSGAMDGTEQGSRRQAAELKPAIKGSCLVLSQTGCSPLSAFAKDHQPVSRDVRPVERG